MYNETFAPVLFVMPYTGTIDTAIGLANAPKNAGLVNAIYTQNQVEADRFAEMNGAGHGVINPKMGTGTPAHGMGFGGNKASGQGETLARDPEKPFTKEGNAEPIMGYKEETKTHFLHKRMSMKGTIQRIAQDKEVEMDW
jgi:acyl-CoA reductase-like NAD-dependent aldehyde dehydrogenase